MTGPLQESSMKILRSRYHVDVYDGPLPAPYNTVVEGIRDADGLICYPFDVIDAGVIDAAPHLKVISTYSVGYDHVDIVQAMSRKVTIGYTPDVLTDATADMTLALMLDLLRRVTEGDRMIRSGRWREVCGATGHLGVGIRGKTLGIIGMGRIGAAVARRASAFGMKITYYNRTRHPRRHENELNASYASFEKVISDSDVVSVHVPYSHDTHHMFDSAVFGMMKRSAFLINTARGKVVNEADLADALKSGTIAGAGLDVFESEPLDAASPLLDMQNVVVTPHIGSSTVETRSVMANVAILNLDRGMKGKKPYHSVW